MANENGMAGVGIVELRREYDKAHAAEKERQKAAHPGRQWVDLDAAHDAGLLAVANESAEHVAEGIAAGIECRAAVDRLEGERARLLGEVERLTRERDEAGAEVKRLGDEHNDVCDSLGLSYDAPADVVAAKAREALDRAERAEAALSGLLDVAGDRFPKSHAVEVARDVLAKVTR